MLPFSAQRRAEEIYFRGHDTGQFTDAERRFLEIIEQRDPAAMGAIRQSYNSTRARERTLQFRQQNPEPPERSIITNYFAALVNEQTGPLAGLRNVPLVGDDVRQLAGEGMRDRIKIENPIARFALNTARFTPARYAIDADLDTQPSAVGDVVGSITAMLSTIIPAAILAPKAGLGTAGTKGVIVATSALAGGLESFNQGGDIGRVAVDATTAAGASFAGASIAPRSLGGLAASEVGLQLPITGANVFANNPDIIARMVEGTATDEDRAILTGETIGALIGTSVGIASSTYAMRIATARQRRAARSEQEFTTVSERLNSASREMDPEFAMRVIDIETAKAERQRQVADFEGRTGRTPAEGEVDSAENILARANAFRSAMENAGIPPNMAPDVDISLPNRVANLMDAEAEAARLAREFEQRNGRAPRAGEIESPARILERAEVIREAIRVSRQSDIAQKNTPLRPSISEIAGSSPLRRSIEMRAVQEKRRITGNRNAKLTEAERAFAYDQAISGGENIYVPDIQTVADLVRGVRDAAKSGSNKSLVREMKRLFSAVNTAIPEATVGALDRMIQRLTGKPLSVISKLRRAFNQKLGRVKVDTPDQTFGYLTTDWMRTRGFAPELMAAARMHDEAVLQLETRIENARRSGDQNLINSIPKLEEDIVKFRASANLLRTEAMKPFATVKPLSPVELRIELEVGNYDNAAVEVGYGADIYEQTIVARRKAEMGSRSGEVDERLAEELRRVERRDQEVAEIASRNPEVMQGLADAVEAVIKADELLVSAGREVGASRSARTRRAKSIGNRFTKLTEALERAGVKDEEAALRMVVSELRRKTSLEVNIGKKLVSLQERIMKRMEASRNPSDIEADIRMLKGAESLLKQIEEKQELIQKMPSNKMSSKHKRLTEVVKKLADAEAITLDMDLNDVTVFDAGRYMAEAHKRLDAAHKAIVGRLLTKPRQKAYIKAFEGVLANERRQRSLSGFLGGDTQMAKADLFAYASSVRTIEKMLDLAMNTDSIRERVRNTKDAVRLRREIRDLADANLKAEIDELEVQMSQKSFVEIEEMGREQIKTLREQYFGDLATLEKIEATAEKMADQIKRLDALRTAQRLENNGVAVGAAESMVMTPTMRGTILQMTKLAQKVITMIRDGGFIGSYEATRNANRRDIIAINRRRSEIANEITERKAKLNEERKAQRARDEELTRADRNSKKLIIERMKREPDRAKRKELRAAVRALNERIAERRAADSGRIDRRIAALNAEIGELTIEAAQLSTRLQSLAASESPFMMNPSDPEYQAIRQNIIKMLMDDPDSPFSYTYQAEEFLGRVERTLMRGELDTVTRAYSRSPMLEIVSSIVRGAREFSNIDGYDDMMEYALSLQDASYQDTEIRSAIIRAAMLGMDPQTMSSFVADRAFTLAQNFAAPRMFPGFAGAESTISREIMRGGPDANLMAIGLKLIKRAENAYYAIKQPLMGDFLMRVNDPEMMRRSTGKGVKMYFRNMFRRTGAAFNRRHTTVEMNLMNGAVEDVSLYRIFEMEDRDALIDYLNRGVAALEASGAKVNIPVEQMRLVRMYDAWIDLKRNVTPILKGFGVNLRENYFRHEMDGAFRDLLISGDEATAGAVVNALAKSMTARYVEQVTASGASDVPRLAAEYDAKVRRALWDIRRPTQLPEGEIPTATDMQGVLTGAAEGVLDRAAVRQSATADFMLSRDLELPEFVELSIDGQPPQRVPVLTRDFERVILDYINEASRVIAARATFSSDGSGRPTRFASIVSQMDQQNIATKELIAMFRQINTGLTSEVGNEVGYAAGLNELSADFVRTSLGKGAAEIAQRSSVFAKAVTITGSLPTQVLSIFTMFRNMGYLNTVKALAPGASDRGMRRLAADTLKYQTQAKNEIAAEAIRISELPDGSPEKNLFTEELDAIVRHIYGTNEDNVRSMERFEARTVTALEASGGSNRLAATVLDLTLINYANDAINRIASRATVFAVSRMIKRLQNPDVKVSEKGRILDDMRDVFGFEDPAAVLARGGPTLEELGQATRRMRSMTNGIDVASYERPRILRHWLARFTFSLASVNMALGMNTAIHLGRFRHRLRDDFDAQTKWLIGRDLAMQVFGLALSGLYKEAVATARDRRHPSDDPLTSIAFRATAEMGYSPSFLEGLAFTIRTGGDVRGEVYEQFFGATAHVRMAMDTMQGIYRTIDSLARGDDITDDVDRIIKAVPGIRFIQDVGNTLLRPDEAYDRLEERLRQMIDNFDDSVAADIINGSADVMNATAEGRRLRRLQMMDADNRLRDRLGPPIVGVAPPGVPPG